MKSFIVAALLSCFAMQVFAQQLSTEDLNKAAKKCVGDKNEVDDEIFVCYYKELEVLKDGQINQKKLEDVLAVTPAYKDLSDDQRMKLAKMCAEEGNKEKDEKEKAVKVVKCIPEKVSEVKESK